MIHAQTFHLVQWYQDPCQEELMFFFQWQGEAVDNGTQNLEQLSNTIEAFGLINELEEDIVDWTTDVWPQVEEFAVDSM